MAPIRNGRFIDSEHPNTWNSGRQARNTSLPSSMSYTHAVDCTAFAVRLRWVSGTPFATPVVPDV